MLALPYGALAQAPSTAAYPSKIVRVVIFVVVIVVILALPIWLGTGPVVLSP